MRGKLFGLKRPRVRQSWSKWNLYNLTRQTIAKSDRKTFFQQKWASKAETRAYHGEYLTARQWQNIFRPTLKAVVPMFSADLADNSGAQMATGRGAGLGGGVPRRQAVPYMSQLYSPMERRLDVACHRAMFAASPRMARQFVIHGFVAVNGKKMTHPNYMLNPGDMFSVDQRKVLWATGAPKLGRIKTARKSEDESEGDEAASEEAPDPVTPDEVAAEAEAGAGAGAGAGAREAAGVLTEREATGGEFAGKKGPEKKPWTKHDDSNNPIDVTKPYATPWRPRDYLPPFAFIPRYLEVNHNTCHAVYLRHPVARPGLTEVPSPHGPETMQLAFNWFLRRR